MTNAGCTISCYKLTRQIYLTERYNNICLHILYTTMVSKARLKASVPILGIRTLGEYWNLILASLQKFAMPGLMTTAGTQISEIYQCTIRSGGTEQQSDPTKSCQLGKASTKSILEQQTQGRLRAKAIGT